MNKLMPILAALLALLAACSRGFRDDLQRADDLMETAPDSAMALLQAVDTATLAGRDLPYYALLYTQAQVKTDAAPASDSLIAIALEAFRHDPAPDLRLRAHFYSAKIAFNNENLPDAMRGAIVAYDISKAQNDDYWRAKAAELMADIFSKVYCDPQAAQCTREAAHYYLKAGKIRNHRYSLCDLATDYLNQGYADSALSLLDSIRAVMAAETPFDSALNNYAIGVTLPALLQEKRYDDFQHLANEYACGSSSDEMLDFAICQSYIAADNEDFGTMSDLLSDAYGLSDDRKEQIRILYASYQHAFSCGQYREAALMSDTLLTMQSRIARNVLNESVISIQRDYYSNQAIFQGQKSKMLAYALVTVICVAIFIIILIVIIYRLRLRAKRSELENNLASLLYFKEQSANKTHTIETLFKEKWSTINMLCNEYFTLDDSETSRKALLKNIEHELDKLRTKKNLKEIEKAVDTYLGGIMTLLRSECDFIKENDFVFLSLVFAGLSARAVCLLTGINYKNYYQKKQRLTQRIAASSAPDKELFTRHLSRA